jgi:hypothetical protein
MDRHGNVRFWPIPLKKPAVGKSPISVPILAWRAGWLVDLRVVYMIIII